MFRTGLVSVSFRPLSVKEVFEASKKAGVNYIEWGSDIHAPAKDVERIAEISALSKEYGIPTCSYGTYFRLGQTPNSELIDYINAAKMLGTDILRLWAGNKNYEAMTEQEFEDFAAICREAAKIAKENGVVLCLECHNGTVTNCLEGALKIMEAVNSESFRMYWQPNQNVVPEQNHKYASAIAPYTKVIHAFNWKGKEKFSLGDAIDVWKKYLTFFDGSQAVLLEFMPDGSVDSLKTETDALKIITG